MLQMFGNFAQAMSSQASANRPNTNQPQPNAPSSNAQPNLMGMMNQLSGNRILIPSD